MKTKIIALLLLTLGLPSMQAQNTQEGFQQSNTFTAKNPDKLFVGAIITAKSLNQDTHRFLDVPLHPITISSMSPFLVKEIAPSYANMMEAVTAAVREKGTLTQSTSFGYLFRELKSYRELPLFFGQSIDNRFFFGTSSLQKTRKTLAIVDIDHIFFDVTMDLQEEICSDPKALEPFAGEELIYVASVYFGRRAILVIESDYSYADVKGAVEYTIKKARNIDTETNGKHEAVYANSTIRVMTLGGKDLGRDDATRPLSNLVSYLTLPANIDDFGAPIAFSAISLKDNSSFINKFTLE